MSLSHYWKTNRCHLKLATENCRTSPTMIDNASISTKSQTDTNPDATAGPEGQDHWEDNYPYCGGAFQSPINIQSELMRFDPTLRPIDVRNYNLSPNEQLMLGNNGHSGEGLFLLSK